MGLLYVSPSTVWCDNQSTVHISRNGIKGERTKHIDTKYYFIVDESQSNVILPSWVSTIDQHADILTKPLSREVFTRLRNQLMIEV
jgi:hypothetical protein